MNTLKWDANIAKRRWARCSGSTSGLKPGAAAVRLALLLLGTALLFAGCSELSIQSLLENEQDGEFLLNEREVHLQADGDFTLTASGGFTPYTFEIEDGVGEMDSASGRYRAPGALNNGNVIDVPVVARDSAGATSESLIRLYDRLSADPRTIEIAASDPGDETVSIQVDGGFGQYEYEVESGNVDVTDSPANGPWTLEYTAPAAAGSDTLRIFDGIGNRITIRITVYAPDELRIVPSSRTIVLDPDLDPETVTFDIEGGTAPYPMPQQNPSNFGSIAWLDTPNDGGFDYTVDTAGSATLTVTAGGENAEATVTVVEEDLPELSISPPSISLSSGGSSTLTASGGVPPYEFSVEPGAGHQLEELDDDEARFTFDENVPSGLRGKSWEILVVDSQDEMASSTVHHNEE